MKHLQSHISQMRVLLVVGEFILSLAALAPRLEAQVVPFTVVAGSPPTLTFIANPNPSYSIATSYFTDNANAYTVTLTPTTAVSASSSSLSPVFSVGDGSTFTINSNVTLINTTGTIANFNGNASGSNAGTLTSSFLSALTVSGTLSLANTGSITGGIYGIIANGNIVSLTNGPGATISGGVVGVDTPATIVSLDNKGTIHGTIGIDAVAITTLTNEHIISGTTFGIFDQGGRPGQV